jgi:uncharacterized protein involved in exopolysaccharide biosynthesis
MKDAEAPSDFGSYAMLFRRRRVWILTIVPAALLISLYLSFALPPEYRSTATVILEQASIPQDFIAATVRSYADQQIEIISGRVMTPAALIDLVNEIDPYPEETTWDANKKALEIIKDTELERVDPVTLQHLEESTAFSLHYQNPDPRRAAIIAKRLADLFLTYHQRQRVEAAKEAEKLIADRAAMISKDLQALDEQFAQLRSQHGGTLPDASDRNEDQRYRAERDLDDLDKQLRTAQEQESLLSIQLAATSPNLLATQGLGSSALQNPATPTQGPLTDLATVKALLADAELRYTPDHPDVKRLKRALAALEAQQGSQQSGGNLARDAANPEYRRIAQELASTRSEVTALTAEVARKRVQVERYEASSNPSAELAQQVNSLERRRQSLQNEFLDVQNKLKNAQLGQVAEATASAEHFSMVRAPTIASMPYSPNRIGITLLGFVLGCAIAAAAVAWAEAADNTVRGMRDVTGFAPIRVLGSVSEILMPADMRRRGLLWGTVFAVYLAFAVLVTVTIVQATTRDHHVVQTASST